MAIRITSDLAHIDASNLQGFFVGWPTPPTPAQHLALLYGSAHAWLAIEEDSGTVVGFATLLTDGVLYAYLPLLEVLPAWQGQGIGTRLVRAALEQTHDCYALDLCCDPTLVPFYRRLGFQEVAGMVHRNPAALSGGD